MLFFLLFQAYASRGYVAISVDTCYHGERATNTHAYRDVRVPKEKTFELCLFFNNNSK